MLASMGVSAAAEDETAAATTVTTSEEAVTTAATEATTTMETTTATEMTSVETTTDSETETTVAETTVATEENVAVGKQEIHSGDTVTFTGTLSYRIDKNRPVLDLDAPLDVVVYNDSGSGTEQTITYVRLNDENLNYEEGARLTVTGTAMMLLAGTSQDVIFLNDMVIKENSEPETISTVDEKTETIIEQGKNYTVKFVLYTKSSDSYYISVYVDGKISNLADIPVGRYAESSLEKSVDGYAGISKGSESEITITDWGNGTTTSFHYRYNPTKGMFVDSFSYEDPIEIVTEEMLYNKFVAAYGKPVTVDYGDFNNDGELDAYCTYLVKGTGTVNTYFVTKDSIIYAGVAGDDMGTNDFAYFECSGYRFRANLRTRIPVAYAVGSLSIDRIEADGTLKSVNFGEEVLQDFYGMNNTPNFLSDLTAEQACDVSSYFTSNGDMITVTHYLYDNGRDVGSTNYVYDAAKNAFVEGDSPVQPTVLEIHSNDSMTVTGTLSYEWDQINENNNFKHAILTLDTPITVKYMDGEWVGKTETIDSVQIDIEDELSEGTRLEVTGNVMYAHTGHHLRNIVLTDCTYKVLGKKNGGTTLNKPSNTTGTPKTGDVATLPAVALGLTMTAAGVAAIIYKKRK